MKEIKLLLAIVMLLGGSAAAQVYSQCANFPCTVKVTKAQCGQFPCTVIVKKLSCPAPGVVVNNNTCSCPAPNTVVNGVCTTPVVKGVTVSPLSLTLSSALNTKSAVALVTITNNGAAAIPFNDTIVGQGFNWGGVGTCGGTQLLPGSCVDSITYTPTGLANVSGTLTLTYGSPLTTTVVSLNGTTTKSHDVQLNWVASAAGGTNCDTSTPPICNSAAAGYNLYRAGIKIGSVAGASTTTYIDVAPPAGNYTYEARAYGANGVESMNNPTVVIAVPSATAMARKLLSSSKLGRYVLFTLFALIIIIWSLWRGKVKI